MGQKYDVELGCQSDADIDRLRVVGRSMLPVASHRGTAAAQFLGAWPAGTAG